MTGTDTVALSGSRARLPGSVRALLGADLVTAFGVGLTQPYLVVLLHTARGVPLAAATAIVASAAIASLVGNPVAGALIDRFSARRVMAAGVLTALGGSLILGLVDAPIPDALAVAATGFGWSLALPALATRIALLVPEESHPRAYTFQYVLFNVGLGLGAALAGTVAAGPALPALWLAAACTCAASTVVALSLHDDATRPTTARNQSSPVPPPPGTPAGYRVVLADRNLRRVLVAVAAMATVGYGMFLAVPAVLALNANDPVALSWATATNAVVIVLGLPIALKLGATRQPRTLLALTAVLWAAAWACCIPAALHAGPTSAGPTSAGSISAGPTSAGSISAGPTSAGSISAGSISAELTSAGAISIGPLDFGPFDFGPLDFGPLDIGSIAIGPFDAGVGLRIGLSATAALIGAGELLLAGALPTLVNSLAPDGLRGRYNALSTLALTIGMATGPLLTALATGIGGIGYLVPAGTGVALLALVTLRSR